MSCAALSLNAENDVHELPHSPLINRIPGHAVDLETRADDGAVGEAEQFRGVAGAETGVDQYRYTRAGHGLSDVGQSRGFRGLTRDGTGDAERVRHRREDHRPGHFR